MVCVCDPPGRGCRQSLSPHSTFRITGDEGNFVVKENAIAKDPQKILFDAFWGPEGWRSGFALPEDRQTAIAAGVMFEPRRISHDEGVAWAVRSVGATSKQAVVAGFVASLSRRRFDIRSALGSYATTLHLKTHEAGQDQCPICGLYAKSDEPEDLNTLNFERLKWGGVRHLDPIYAGFDLDLFGKLERPDPSPEDQALLARILETAITLPAGSRARDLEKGLKFLPSNKSEREILVDILGYLGILKAANAEGFRLRYIPWADRQEPPVSKTDWQYPASWWRGGVDEDAVKEWFGEWL